MSKTTRKWMGRIAAGAGLSLAVQASAWADWALNMPRGVTDISNEVYDLHMLIFGICVVIAVVVFGAMIWSIFHHRKSRGVEPAKFSHSTKVEIIWTVIPIVILVAMAVPAADTLIRMEDTRNSDLTVKVTGYQWKWHYEYLDEGVQLLQQPRARISNRARQLRSGIDRADRRELPARRGQPAGGPGRRQGAPAADRQRRHPLPGGCPTSASRKTPSRASSTSSGSRPTSRAPIAASAPSCAAATTASCRCVVEVLPEDEFTAWLAEQAPQPRRPWRATRPGERCRRGARRAAAGRRRAPHLPSLLPRPQAWTHGCADGEGATSTCTHCAACHQADGTGLPAAGFPALAGSPVGTGRLDEHIERGAAMVGTGTAMAPSAPSSPTSSWPR